MHRKISIIPIAAQLVIHRNYSPSSFYASAYPLWMLESALVHHILLAAVRKRAVDVIPIRCLRLLCHDIWRQDTALIYFIFPCICITNGEFFIFLFLVTCMRLSSIGTRILFNITDRIIVRIASAHDVLIIRGSHQTSRAHTYQ